jgi:hypothetical protein
VPARIKAEYNHFLRLPGSESLSGTVSSTQGPATERPSCHGTCRINRAVGNSDEAAAIAQFEQVLDK